MILSGVLLGFIGSLHCIAMCGPLLVSVHRKFPSYQFIPWQVWYHAGRILTYSFLGLLLSTVGLALSLAGIQGAISIALGTVILLYFLFPGFKKRLKRGSSNVYLISGKMSGLFSRAFHYSYSVSAFLGGVLNGLLPCGLVYLALSGALTSQGYFEGQVYMVGFGIGTIPGLLILPSLIEKVRNSYPGLSNRIIWIVGTLFGLYLIYRGLGLGYPGSPELIYNRILDTIITVCGLDD